MNPDIQIVEKPDWVSWDEIHDVIWESHEENRNNGINMLYPSLSGDEIKKKLGPSGVLFVALDGNKVIGTAALNAKKANLWCGKGFFGYNCFDAVLPEYSGSGVYRRLCSFREDEYRRKGITRVIFDTHESNLRVADINMRNGYKRVAYKWYRDHFNIVFVKWLDGCPYSDFRCRLELSKSKVLVKSIVFIKTVIHK